MAKWSQIRDFFWPMLERAPDSGGHIDNKLSVDQCDFVDEENLNQAIKIALSYAKSEDERRSSVETKAALYIGTFSLAVTILLGMIKDYILNIESYSAVLVGIVVFFTGLIIVFLCRAVLYSVDALSRKNYHALGIPSYLYERDKNYKVKLFVEIRNDIFANFTAINSKVDSMTMAQDFFKCAVRTAMLLAGILLVFFIVA